MELTFDKGRGYVPAERNKQALIEKNDISTLPVDSIYTPVLKCNYTVENLSLIHILRQGMPIGAKVTLRGERMYEFVDRLFNVALPRVRDFRGINGNSFDGRGNYAFGLKEQIIFPEIDFDKVDAVRGMDICFVTTAKTDEEAKELLKALGAPFAN